MNNLSRREFLGLTILGAGIINISSAGYTFCKELITQNNVETIPRLNPGFRIKKVSKNEIALYTNKGNGKILSYPFNGFEADLLSEITHEKKMGSIIKSLSKKYNITQSKCRAMLDKSLRNLESKKLIYFGEKMLVKVVEVTNVT